MRSHESRAQWPLIWSAGGLVLLILLFFRAAALEQGGPTARLAVAAVLCLLAVLALLFLNLSGESFPRLAVLCFPIALSLFLRVFLLDHQTLDYLDFLAKWAAFFRNNGGLAALGRPIGNYNVPYLYFLALISYLDIPDLYLIKLFSILFDVLLAWAGWRLVRRFAGAESVRPAVAFCLLLFLPTVLLNGSFWAQCDSLYAALCLHALASALERRPASSVLLLSLAFSFKLQAIFLLPLWCVLWYGGRVKFRHLLLFPAGYLATALPALLAGRSLGSILGIYLEQTSYYSALTLNAPSVYALIPYGARIDEALAAKLGILAAFALVLALLLALFFFRKSLSDRAILLAGAAMALGVPLFLPHMHDRYFFLADCTALLLAVLWPRRHAVTAVLVQIASLGAYHAYLVLRYAFPMGLGTLLNLFALLLILLDLIFELKHQKRLR